MKLDPSITPEEIEALLLNQSGQVYGPERTGELAGQIGQLAVMLARLANRELDLRDAPPDTSGIVDRGAR
jgi:hypothetical protein